jgi:predicted phosphate transport protein (TIGR00153 family)
MVKRHVTKVVDAAEELDNIMDAAVRGRKDELTSAFKRLIMDEKAADGVEISLVEELSRGELPAKDREDLMRLVSSLDLIADWLKVSGKNVELLQETGVTIPPEVWSSFKEMTKNTLDCARALKEMIDFYGTDYDRMVGARGVVKRLENAVDDLYFSNRKILVKIHTNPGIVVILNDLLEGIENATDYCKHSSDTLLSLALQGR